MPEAHDESLSEDSVVIRPGIARQAHDESLSEDSVSRPGIARHVHDLSLSEDSVSAFGVSAAIARISATASLSLTATATSSAFLQVTTPARPPSPGANSSPATSITDESWRRLAERYSELIATQPVQTFLWSVIILFVGDMVHLDELYTSICVALVVLIVNWPSSRS